MDNKMTDNEIKKALECCVEGKCQLCPLYDNDTIADNCPTGLLKLCLDLINRKQAESERLRAENKNQKLAIEEIEDIINPLPFETDFEKAIRTAKSETIKELIDMIQDKSFMDQLSMDGEKIVYMKDIDNLRQEMINQII
jgi:hypothetical protein